MRSTVGTAGGTTFEKSGASMAESKRSTGHARWAMRERRCSSNKIRASSSNVR